jgi:hypothetical protein
VSESIRSHVVSLQAAEYLPQSGVDGLPAAPEPTSYLRRLDPVHVEFDHLQLAVREVGECAGEYGPLSFINKPITIDGNGVGASIDATNSTGVYISGTGGPVEIRNLAINGSGGSPYSGIISTA